VFVRVYESAAEVKKSMLKRTMVYQSNRCPSFYLQPVGTTFQNTKHKTHAADDGDQEVNNETAQDPHLVDDKSNERFPMQSITTKIPKGYFTAAKAIVSNECEESKSSLKIGGPFWGDVIHQQSIVDELLRRVDSCEIGMCSLYQLYHSFHSINKSLMWMLYDALEGNYLW
jgi:tRNA G26 N,N-dimethylase Trm1